LIQYITALKRSQKVTDFDCILLASGGLDSTVLAYKLEKDKKNSIILFLNYGQHCVDKEYQTLQKIVPVRFKDNIRVINIRDIYQESDSRMINEANLWVDEVSASDLYLPYRNLLFLSIASAYAQSIGIRDIYSAFINSNHAKEIDCSMEFFSKLDSLLEEYGSVKIHMPFRHMTKTDVARLGVSIGAPVAVTYSCQVNSNTPCGACPNCVDRIDAINNLVQD
jgi:7-cyano-7-deazaguanine synthase